MVNVLYLATPCTAYYVILPQSTTVRTKTYLQETNIQPRNYIAFSLQSTHRLIFHSGVLVGRITLTCAESPSSCREWSSSSTSRRKPREWSSCMPVLSVSMSSCDACGICWRRLGKYRLGMEPRGASIALVIHSTCIFLFFTRSRVDQWIRQPVQLALVLDLRTGRCARRGGFCYARKKICFSEVTCLQYWKYVPKSRR